MSEESSLPSSILLPANLLHWSCQLCQEVRLEPSKELVLQHISEEHSNFFLVNSEGWCAAACRICQVEGTEAQIRLHVEQHRRESFAKDQKRKRSPSVEVEILKEKVPSKRSKKKKTEEGTKIKQVYKCEVCNKKKSSRKHLDRHKAGKEHIQAMNDVKTRNNLQYFYCSYCYDYIKGQVSWQQHLLSYQHNEAMKRIYCQYCKTYNDNNVLHYHCDLCDAHCNSPLNWQQHLQSKKHEAALNFYCLQCNVHCTNPLNWHQHIQGKKHNSQRESVNAPINSTPKASVALQQSPKSQPRQTQLPESGDQSQWRAHLNTHPPSDTGQKKVLSAQPSARSVQNPRTSVVVQQSPKSLQCQKIKSQGIIMCKLCPEQPGSPGLWFTNILNLLTIKNHFAKLHPGKETENYLDQIILGCKLCPYQLPGSGDRSQWRAHLNTHPQAKTGQEGEIAAQPSPSRPQEVC